METSRATVPGEHASPLTVLVVADDADFARTIVSRWQSEPTVPTFTVVGSEVFDGAGQRDFSLAVLGPVRGARRESLLQALEASAAPVICVVSDAESVQWARWHSGRVVVLRRYDGWVEALIAVAAEALRRAQAVARLRLAEHNANANKGQAALGRYMVEMRHGMNNCLTSILGNAELLLLEPGLLSAEAREQMQTIHTMALRLHEVLQRFSSLESDLRSAERKSQPETESVSQAAVSSA